MSYDVIVVTSQHKIFPYAACHLLETSARDVGDKSEKSAAGFWKLFCFLLLGGAAHVSLVQNAAGF